MIVINTPWLRRTNNSVRIDDAIYYNKTLFSDFFIEEKNGFYLKVIGLNWNVAIKKYGVAAFVKTKRELNLRSLEEVELWVLINV